MLIGAEKRIFQFVAMVFAAALLLAAIWAWVLNSARHKTIQAQRARNLKRLYVALVCYAEKYGGLPPSHTTDAFGKPMHSWRVLLLPFLDRESVYSRIDLNQPWDSPANRRIMEEMPECYRSPLETGPRGTTADYFAVVGPHAPWWSAEQSKPWNTGGSDEVMLIEVVGSKTPWMEPRDPTLEELLDMLRPDRGKSADSSCEADIMYLTVSGDVRIVDPKADRESLLKRFLGRTK